MKRTLATLGVAGLGLIGLTAPAMAASDRVVVCHDDGGTWTPLEFDVNGIGGHRQHADDIIPPTPKVPEGLNWTNSGKIAYIANCAPLPPGETPPVYPPVGGDTTGGGTDGGDSGGTTGGETGGTTGGETGGETGGTTGGETGGTQANLESSAVEAKAGAPVVPAQPAAATPQVPARTGAAASATTNLGTNKGYNAQTAVGGAEYSPAWVAGLAALVAAGAAVAVRRRADASAAG